MKTFPARKRMLILSVFLAITVLPFSADAAPTFISATRPDLPEVARGVPMGGAMGVFDLELDKIGSTSLELERFTVFEDGAQLIVDNNSSVAPPTDAYFRGRVKELPDSIAVLAIPEQGPMRGIITDTVGVWLLAGNSGHSAPGLINRKINLDKELKGKPFICGTEQLAHDVAGLLPSSDAGTAETASLPANVTHTARVAVETDYEYYAMFGDVNAANTYMADLFAYASTVYEREVNTNLVISWSRLWTGGPTSDPWNATSGTGVALDEFQAYWNSGGDAEIPATRTIAHMLSGKGLGGGIAYLGVLCYSHYGYTTNYDFGVSASLSGNFNINDPSVIWDILVVTHEIGHNFDSSHTHDYCGIGGNSNPVDLCYTSTGCGSQIGLPGENSLSGGTTAESPGTIMSYCHLLSGTYNNISFTFGQGHIYGVDAFRVPDVMQTHVNNRAATFPACLALDSGNPVLTVNKTGTGDGLITSDPAGINCGATCSAGFPETTSVQLSAVADLGSEFIGWGGDCNETGSVTLDTDKTCTAEFRSQCGNGVLDAGEACDGEFFAAGVSCEGCSGTPSCNPDCSVNLSPCYNNSCDAGEDCTTCPQDCIGGTFSGAVCGNGVCEAGNGEDCVSCPADCAGVQGGKPSGRFCCGDGDGNNPVGCDDSRCGGADVCTNDTAADINYCCGDGVCDEGETSCSCSLDCGIQPVSESSCTDNIDNDCDGLIDCSDSDCDADSACGTSSCSPTGASCSEGTDCCSNKCNGKPGQKTCG